MQGSADGFSRSHTDVLRDPMIRSKNMNRFGNSSKSLPWISAMLLAVLSAGWGGGDGSTDKTPRAGLAGGACVALGKAGPFGVLAKLGSLNVPASSITGKLGFKSARGPLI